MTPNDLRFIMSASKPRVWPRWVFDLALIGCGVAIGWLLRGAA